MTFFPESNVHPCFDTKASSSDPDLEWALTPMLATSAELTIQVKIIAQSFSSYAWKGTLNGSNHNFSNSVFEPHTLHGVIIP